MEEALQHFFEARGTLPLLLILAGAIAVLVKGTDWLVDGAVGLSERLGISKVIIGATIVSLGTTTPETAVSVLAAFRGMPDLALGNAVGSIICDTALIFGLSAVLVHLPKDPFILNRHGWIQFGSGVLLVVVSFLFYDEVLDRQIIPRAIGFVFIALLLGYLYISVRWARKHVVEYQKVDLIDEERERLHLGMSVPVNAGMLLVGLFMVLAASNIAVPNVRVLCVRWHVPPAILSATLIAFGTSLPELITAMASIRKGHTDLLIGNVIGADILNVLFVIGASACAVPHLVVDPLFFRLHFPIMILVLVLFRLHIFFSRDRFARWPGFVFLAVFAVYIISNVVFSPPAP
ncbi:calcium/sodium antiporter [bacterium]|nr:calcium/sodium antiporter [bacterium]